MAGLHTYVSIGVCNPEDLCAVKDTWIALFANVDVLFYANTMASKSGTYMATQYVHFKASHGQHTPGFLKLLWCELYACLHVCASAFVCVCVTVCAYVCVRPRL